MRRMTLHNVIAALLLAAVPASAAAQGLASKYPNDKGLKSDPAVLYFLDFDDKAATAAWTKGKKGYGWTDTASHVFSGGGALEIQQYKGTHDPYEIHPQITASDEVYVRWYRKWQVGYDFTQHKMPGVYAKAPGASTAGVKPNGTDKYSCKLYVDFNKYPRFYSYHPDQQGIYGDGLHMNLVDPKLQVKADRWYCFEMMIKANNAPTKDGELKMWIDGKLVGHYKNMRFRDVNTLKINEFTYSAYVGGTWTSKQDQKLWDDQIVVATKYIGPLSAGSVTSDGPGVDGSVSADKGASLADSGGATTDSGKAAADSGGQPDAALASGPRGVDGCSCQLASAPHGPGAEVLFALLLVGLAWRRWRQRWWL
jgi:MYXO-CTERM domain-containing protein